MRDKEKALIGGRHEGLLRYGWGLYNKRNVDSIEKFSTCTFSLLLDSPLEYIGAYNRTWQMSCDKDGNWNRSFARAHLYHEDYIHRSGEGSETLHSRVADDRLCPDIPYPASIVFVELQRSTNRKRWLSEGRRIASRMNGCARHDEALKDEGAALNGGSKAASSAR